ncbi:3-hydroxypropanoate dehydrogenase [Actinomyces ruminicola]|uniref:3-hydroxypropanoate dehydrogenase n=1 Tax=Actinomyces ruminicola TaxID=332524 RepID=A0A1H0E138_9ACTO|nr:malonic semialdehyde reductase [Actinomyces ruminicola]SDN75951.1 3-hydroxypropanoate dehydrogenase [Actinomyces ruminicola]
MSSHNTAVSDDALAVLFTNARTARSFRDEPAAIEQVRRAYDNARWAPTALNSQPMRLDLLASPESRQRLVPLMAGINQEPVLGAPLALIVSADLALEQSMRELGAPEQMLQRLAGSLEMRQGLARDSALIQLGYLVLALRAEGLDVGVMTGADLPGIDAEFHADRPWQAIAVVIVGHADADAYRPRAARHDFDAVSQVL